MGLIERLVLIGVLALLTTVLKIIIKLDWRDYNVPKWKTNVNDIGYMITGAVLAKYLLD